MAGSISESLIQIIECSICFEVMREPKTLQCEHSFCKECLESCVDLDSRKIPLIRCPTCREETSLVDVETVHGLKAQLILRQILDGIPEYTKKHEQFNKENQESEEKLSPRCCMSFIEWYCCDCKSYFCNKCFNFHSLLSKCGSVAVADQDEYEHFFQVKYCEAYGTFTPYCGRHDSFHRHGCLRCLLTFCNYCYHEHLNKVNSDDCKIVSFKEYGSKFNEPLLDKITLMINHKEKRKRFIDKISNSTVDSQKEIIQKHIEERKVVILSQVIFLLQSIDKQVLNNFDNELNSYNEVKKKLRDDINSELDLVDNFLNKSENLAKQSLLEIISQTKDLQEEFNSILTEDVLAREIDFPEIQVDISNSNDIAVNQFNKLFSCVQEIFGNCAISTVKDNGNYEQTLAVCDTTDNDNIDCRTSMLLKLTDAKEAKKYLTKGLKQMNLLPKSDNEKKIKKKGPQIVSVSDETVEEIEEKEDLNDENRSFDLAKEERCKLRSMYNDSTVGNPMDEKSALNILCHPHPLRLQHRKKWNCQVCGKENKACKSYFCGACKYDACIDCVKIISSTEDSLALPKDEQLEIPGDEKFNQPAKYTAYIAGLPNLVPSAIFSV